MRVVAWSALRGPLRRARSATRRARWRTAAAHLDLVVLGDAPVPQCLVEIELRRALYPPPAARPAVGFRVERIDDPAVRRYSEAGGLPVEFAAGHRARRRRARSAAGGRASVPADERMVLEIVDFPALELGAPMALAPGAGRAPSQDHGAP